MKQENTHREDLVDNLSLSQALGFFLPDEPHVVVEPVPARDGCTTLRVGGRFVHSSIAPAREAERLVTRFLAGTPQSVDAIVVIGLGLGYHLEELSRQKPGVPLVVAEAVTDVVHAARAHRDSAWWDRYGPQVLLPADRSDLVVSALRSLRARRFAVLTLQSATQQAPEVVAELHHALQQYRTRSTVNTNTLRRFGRLWVRNTLRNLTGGSPPPGIDALVDAAPGGSALICGAGPTLDDVLPEIKRFHRSMLVIAVDTAVAPLVRAGAPPHIAVVADPQYWNTRHLDGVDERLSRTILVAEPATHPRVFRLWPGPVLVSASLFPLGTFIDGHLGRWEKLGAGGSVATSGWDLARIMGCRRIYVAGLDLGFPRMRTHCSGSFFEERLIRTTRRSEPAEQGLFRYLHDAHPKAVPAAGGGTVLSDRRMEVYRGWFMEQAIRHPQVKTMVLSPEGAAIPGYQVINTGEALAGEQHRERTPEEVITRILNDHRTRGPGGEILSHALTRLEMQLQVVAAIGARGETVCAELLQRNTLSPGDLTALDRIDGDLQQFEHRELAGFLAEQAIDLAVNQEIPDARSSVIQASEIYRALMEAAEFHRQLIHRYRLL